MEHTSVGDLIASFPDLPFAKVDEDFLDGLQDIHDTSYNNVKDWPQLLENFAAEHNLIFKG